MLILSAQEINSFNSHKDSLPQQKWYNSKAVRISVAPVAFFTAGALTWSERDGVRETRNRYIPDFEKHFDDYTKFLPTVAVYGLNEFGESKMSFFSDIEPGYLHAGIRRKSANFEP